MAAPSGVPAEFPRKLGVPVLSPKRLADPSGQGCCEPGGSSRLTVAPTCLPPRCASQGREGGRDPETSRRRRWPEPRRGGPILRLFASSHLPSGVRAGVRSSAGTGVLGRGAERKQDARCVPRSHRNRAIRTRRWRNRGRNLCRQASSRAHEVRGRPRAGISTAPHFVCTCLSRPDTECNLMTERRGGRKKGRKRAPVAHHSAPPYYPTPLAALGPF